MSIKYNVVKYSEKAGSLHHMLRVLKMFLIYLKFKVSMELEERRKKLKNFMFLKNFEILKRVQKREGKWKA